MIEYVAGTATHYPRLISDGIMHRAVCSCSWAGEWVAHREQAEMDWGRHGVKTIQQRVNKRSFTIIGNPLAKGDSN